MNALVPVVSVTVLGLFGVYLLALGFGYLTNLRRANQLYEAERALISAKITQLGDRLTHLDAGSGQLAWSGFRKFVLAGKVLEADDVCSFYFTPHDGQPLPPYLPGQFLTFQLQPPGSDRPVIRCYSLSDSPTNPDYYRVTVKRIKARETDPESKDGVISTLFHRAIAPDDLVDVRAPSGHFYLDPEQSGPVVLTGGGIGITPLLAMLNFLCATGSKRETWFFYGVTHGGEHVMREYLRALVSEHENIRLMVCFSNPRVEDEKGRDYDYAERVSVELFKRVLPSNNFDFYTCGPAPMMDQITHELQQWGVPENRIHYEAFGAATVKRVGRELPKSESAAGRAVEVEFARSGNTLVWDGSASSLLEFAESSGIPIDSGCRAGNCGSCLTAIRAGNVDYLSEPGAPVEEGSCLACICVPRGQLVLDA